MPFADALRDAVERQAQVPHNPAAAERDIKALFDRYSIAAQLVDGPGKTAWLQQRKANPTPDVPPQGQIGQIAGFRFITYTSDVAVVQLAFRNTMPGSQLPAFTAGIYSLRWQNDWRLQMQQDGSASTEAPNSESLDGYIPWGAV